MATRPTEADEHWNTRQRLRMARRREVAQLYEQRVVPRLATGCHVPGSRGTPTVAHNSSSEAINYCGQVMEGPRPAIDRLMRGDFYRAAGGAVGELARRPQSKSFRCRSLQPPPADLPPTPLMRDAVPPGSARSTCGGRLFDECRLHNMGRSSKELPLKPLIDPPPVEARVLRAARTQPPQAEMVFGERTATPASNDNRSDDINQTTNTKRDTAVETDQPSPRVDAAIDTNDERDGSSAAADATDPTRHRHHHCHHTRQQQQQHGSEDYEHRHHHRPLPQHKDPFAATMPEEEQRVKVPTRRVRGFMQRTQASRAKETHVILQRDKSPVSAHVAQQPLAVRDAYETALHHARTEQPGVAAVLSSRDLAKIQELARKPAHQPLQRKSYRPKDSENFLI